MLLNILSVTGDDDLLRTVLGYSPTVVLNVILAVVVIIVAIDKARAWIKEKETDCHNELSDREDLQELVDDDHEKILKVEKQVDAISDAVRVLLQASLMAKHDAYMARKPSPYVTKYERLMYIETYQAYTTLNNNPLMEGFHKEIMNLPVRILTDGDDQE